MPTAQMTSEEQIDWIVFDGGKIKDAKSEPIITLQSKGVFALNPAAVAALGDTTQVELLYNQEHSLIGLRAPGPDAKRVYPLRIPKLGRVRNVSAQAFCAAFAIPTHPTRHYKARVIGNVLTIDLKSEPILPPSGAPKGATEHNGHADGKR